MQGILTFLHLDGQPASLGATHAMGQTLAQTAWSKGEFHTAGSAALGGMHWAATERRYAPSLLHRHDDTGCVIAADARLTDLDALAKALDLAVPVLPSTTAAELILHAWLRWDQECVQHLEGDFAFVIHDPRKAGLFLARDRIGVRPLYFHLAPGRLLVAGSSASAVLAHPLVPRVINEGRIADFLVCQLEGIDKTSTFFDGVQRLPPAHTMWVDARGGRQRHYWQLQPGRIEGLPKTDGDWTALFLETLQGAIARQLTGGDTLGSMISGGLDSSSIAVLARDARRLAGVNDPLPAFSAIDSADPHCPETRSVRDVLDQGGFHASFADLSQLDQREGLADDLLSSEEPFDCHMAMPHTLYRLAAMAGVTALLDGVDGDLLLQEGQSIARHVRQGRWLQALRNARGARRTYPGMPSVPRQLARAVAHAFLPQSFSESVRRYRSRGDVERNISNSLISPDFASRVDLEGRLARMRAQSFANIRAQPAEEAAAALEHPYLTVGLERYHRTASRHGIEPRHPLLDRRLLELALNLPDRQRAANGWSKVVLRHAMRGRLPETVRLRVDKTSLGWKFTREALSGAFLPDSTHNVPWDVLSPYVDLSKLRLAQQDPKVAADQTVYEAAILASWLARHGRTG